LIKAIFFDLDNTLTDFMRMKELAVDAAISGMLDAGLNLRPEEARQKIYGIYDREGIEFQQVFDHFLQEELGAIDHKILAAGIVAYRRVRDSALVLYPHVQITLVELLRRGIRLAVISDAPKAQVWLRLCSLNLHHVFDLVVAFEDTRERKPSRAPFEAALAGLDLAPGEVLMVGDWPERDMVGARNVGIRTVFARYGDTFGTVHSGADFEIDDVLDLVPIVDRLNAEAGAGAAAPRAPARTP
jgi:putative hydrolase of the HAD superfamily